MRKCCDLAPCETRDQVLSVACEVFAEKGFRQATVQDICKRAGANIAAVNYHFGGKQKLYDAVWRYSFALGLELYPRDAGVTDQDPPIRRMEAFVFAVLQQVFADGPSAAFPKILLREMAEPTGVLEAIHEEALQPQMVYLNALIREILGPQVSEETAMLCQLSVVGQYVFYNGKRSFLAKLLGWPEQPDGTWLQRLARHITTFSVAGMRAAAELSDPETKS